MPRRARSLEGGHVYHVLNRANARALLFQKEAEYLLDHPHVSRRHARLTVEGQPVTTVDLESSSEFAGITAGCVKPPRWPLPQHDHGSFRSAVRSRFTSAPRIP
jgi:hypothetical protein